MKFTYNEVHNLAEYGRVKHGWITYPVQLACKKLIEQGISGKLEICPNNNEDGDGLPDMTYPSILTAAKNANTNYLQKGLHYAAWYPIVENKRDRSDEILIFKTTEEYDNRKRELDEQLAIIAKCEHIKQTYEWVLAHPATTQAA